MIGEDLVGHDKNDASCGSQIVWIKGFVCCRDIDIMLSIFSVDPMNFQINVVMLKEIYHASPRKPKRCL
jgi:hypothetical protein